MQQIFPNNPLPGYLVQLHNRDIFIYDGSFWNLIGGRFLSIDNLRIALNFLDEIDYTDSPTMIRTDLEQAWGEIGEWEEIFIKNLIRTSKNIKKSQLHM